MPIHDDKLRIAVTGLGIVSPLGSGAEVNRRSLRQGMSAIRSGAAGGVLREIPFARCDEAAIGPLRFPKSAKYFSRSVCLAMQAAQEAYAQSGLANRAVAPDRVAVYCASGQTGLDYAQFARALGAAWQGDHSGDFGRLGGLTSRLIDPYFSLRTLANSSVFMIANEFGATGPSGNFVQSDIAPILAIESACFDLIDGRCDAAIVTGHDSLLFPSVIQAFSHAGLLARDPDTASRPFDARSSGIAVGEGAATFVLERRDDALAQGAEVLAEIDEIEMGCAYGTANHAGGIGDRLRQLLTLLVGQDGPPDFFVARGLGVAALDLEESTALASVAGIRPVTAFKGATGYLGAATGAVELALTMLAVQADSLPAIVRLEAPANRELNFVFEQPVPIGKETATAVLVTCGLGGQISVLRTQLNVMREQTPHPETFGVLQEA